MQNIIHNSEKLHDVTFVYFCTNLKLQKNHYQKCSEKLQKIPKNCHALQFEIGGIFSPQGCSTIYPLGIIVPPRGATPFTPFAADSKPGEPQSPTESRTRATRGAQTPRPAKIARTHVQQGSLRGGEADPWNLPNIYR